MHTITTTRPAITPVPGTGSPWGPPCRPSGHWMPWRGDNRPATTRDERRFLAEQETLEKKIETAERNLTALQTGGASTDAASGGPDDEEAAAIKQFRRELLESRKALRDVQGDLRRDVVDRDVEQPVRRSRLIGRFVNHAP